jgi:hypothetical protein
MKVGVVHMCCGVLTFLANIIGMINFCNVILRYILLLCDPIVPILLLSCLLFLAAGLAPSRSLSLRHPTPLITLPNTVAMGCWKATGEGERGEEVDAWT